MPAFGPRGPAWRHLSDLVAIRPPGSERPAGLVDGLVATRRRRRELPSSSMGFGADLALVIAAGTPATVGIVVAEMGRRQAAKAAMHAERVDIAVNGRRPGTTTISDDVTALRDDMDAPSSPAFDMWSESSDATRPPLDNAGE